MGTEEPDRATPLVFRLGVWFDPFTRSQTEPPDEDPDDAPAVTLNGMVSPLDSTLKMALFGAAPTDPVVKLNVRAGGGVLKFVAAEEMLRTGAGFLTDRVTPTVAGLLPGGTVFTV